MRHVSGCLFLFLLYFFLALQQKKAFSFAFSHLCVLEGVRGSDMFVFTFSAKDATEHINVFSYDYNGELFQTL